MVISKITIAVLSASAFLSTMCLAEKPSSCPSIESLSATDFDTANLSAGFPGKWYVMQHNYAYDTNIKWDFAIVVDGNDADDALLQAKKETPLINFPMGPIDSGYGYYRCEYLRPGQPSANAFYPPAANGADLRLRKK